MGLFSAALDFLVVDLLGCALPRARDKPGCSSENSAPTAQRAPRAYNGFDLFAGCGAGFLINLCITIIVPVALSSIESRNHPSPLFGSGSIAATTSIGMVFSVVGMMRWEEVQPTPPPPPQAHPHPTPALARPTQPRREV